MQIGYIFAYVSAVIFIVAILFSPKRLSKSDIYFTWFIMAALTIYIDLFFGYILDLYDFVKPNLTVIDLILEASLVPAAGILIVNFLPKRTRNFAIYLIAVVCLSIVFEWLSTITGYLVYKGWKLIYSVPIYTLGVMYLRWHLHYLRRTTK
ncbi:hypothetical protein E1757_05630 [Paenibacillus piri]|uniref:Uncharacterized protein n=1 Tax=Paenibacillus piri TaxID=2547395 RepID=A0A4R5KTV5_9BACL|nr:hypothetical protein E1757_05630 [Paenibacillus piri]